MKINEKKKLIVFLLILSTIVISEAKSNKHTENLFDKEFRKKQSACEKVSCNFLPSNFNENCINQCISQKCYERTFFNLGLEPGEIDQKRFNCINILKNVTFL